jgi:hypothetical protein
VLAGDHAADGQPGDNGRRRLGFVTPGFGVATAEDRRIRPLTFDEVSQRLPPDRAAPHFAAKEPPIALDQSIESLFRGQFGRWQSPSHIAPSANSPSRFARRRISGFCTA